MKNKDSKLTFRMYSVVEFDRPIEGDKHYISLGGFEMTMKGKSVQFDFEEYRGSINKENPRILETEHKNPDYSCFKDLDIITSDMLHNVEKIEEFFVYTGENDEPEINPVRIKELAFVIIDDLGNMEQIDIPLEILDSAQFWYVSKNLFYRGFLLFLLKSIEAHGHYSSTSFYWFDIIKICFWIKLLFDGLHLTYAHVLATYLEKA